MIKRISITGPESTGKSWLAMQLASRYGEPWAEEYSREYLNKLDRPYNFEDILLIAQGQFKLEEEQAKSAKSYLFCDTDFLVTRIWCLVKYGKSHPWIDHMADTHIYDHYLLCNTDLPWEPDPLREHPELREDLMQLYLDELTYRELPFTVISGQDDDRLQAAVKAINTIQP